MTSRFDAQVYVNRLAALENEPSVQKKSRAVQEMHLECTEAQWSVVWDKYREYIRKEEKEEEGLFDI